MAKMIEKRFTVDGLNIQDNSLKGGLYLLEEQGGVNALCNLINGLNTKTNRLEKENKQLKKDVDYWKQVASQYSNELDVFKHCKKYKTKCKDIYWSSD